MMKPVSQDNLWKKVITDLFEDFLLFFLPDFHAQVDFSKPVEFLQQELFKEIIEDQKGRKMADQIAKVHLKSGEEQWVLVHTEVQARVGDDFPLRMFQYYYRIFDRHQQKIVAIALFTDEAKKGNHRYEAIYFGTELTYTYNKFIIADFDEQNLIDSPKLFSRVLLAAKYMNESKQNMSLRQKYKRALLRDVLTSGTISKTEIRAVLYFVDYLLKLPKELSEQLTEEIRIEIRGEDTQMLELHKEDLPPTIVSILALEHQEGIEKGIEQGRLREKEKVVRESLQMNLDVEVIAKITGLTVEQVMTLKERWKL